MRIRKLTAADREKFVVETFQSNTSLTVKDVNNLLIGQYGFAMNLNKIYRLRKSALEQIGVPYPTRKKAG
jgi:hypothetical protein